MLVVIPSALYGRIGAVLSALLAILPVIGLTVHRDFYAGKRRRDFFCFFTNVSNLLVMLYFAAIAPVLYAKAALRPMIPHVEFSLTMCIMLTFSVFHLLLFPAVKRTVAGAPRTRSFYILLTGNALIHYVVPLLTFCYWLLCSPGKATLTVFDALWWTAIPIVYLLFVFLRAGRGKIIEETESRFPYPFLDTGIFGVRRVALRCLALYGACVLSSLALLGVVWFGFMLFGSGHTLVLI